MLGARPTLVRCPSGYVWGGAPRTEEGVSSVRSVMLLVLDEKLSALRYINSVWTPPWSHYV